MSLGPLLPHDSALAQDASWKPTATYTVTFDRSTLRSNCVSGVFQPQGVVATAQIRKVGWGYQVVGQLGIGCRDD
jgi:hypothetical protein